MILYKIGKLTPAVTVIAGVTKKSSFATASKLICAEFGAESVDPGAPAAKINVDAPPPLITLHPAGAVVAASKFSENCAFALTPKANKQENNN